MPNKKRPRVQKISEGCYRSQIVNPLAPGKRLSISGKSEAEVMRKIDAIRREALEVELHATDANTGLAKIAAFSMGRPLTVKEIWEAHITHLSGDWQRQAKSTWKHRLEQSFAHLSCHELTKEEWETWEAKQKEQGMAVRTIRNCYDLVAAAFNRQIEKGRLSAYPWGKWRARKPAEGENEREALRSLEEVVALLQAAQRRDRKSPGFPNLPAPYFVRCAVLILLGLRNAEGCALAWDDFHRGVDGGLYVTIQRQAKQGWAEVTDDGQDRPDTLPKNDKRRTVQVHKSLAAILAEHKERLEALGLFRANGPVFPTKKGEYRRDDALLKPEVVREIWEEAGLPNAERAVTHSFRHSLGTLEAAKGADVKTVMARLGHSDPKVSLGYIHRVGRGVAESLVPELPLSGTVPEAPEEVLALPSVELGDLPLPTAKESAQFQAELDSKTRGKRENDRANFLAGDTLDFQAVALKWKEDGCQGVRPPAVTDHADKAYAREYLRAQRRAIEAGKSAVVARKAAKVAGFRGRWAVIGCWTRYAKERGYPVPQAPKGQRKKGGRDAA